ncbi:MAG: thiamine pyrophosphate-dependent enzyme, partial [Planctomycetota bacterium]
YSHGEEALARFSGQQQIPVVTPIWDRGSVPAPIDPFVGVIGAASGGASLLPDADLVILVGAEFDYRVGQLSPPVVSPDAKVIRIHADETCLRRGLEAGLGIHAAPGVVLEQLTEACRRLDCRPTSEWLAEARKRRDAFRRRCVAAADKFPTGTNGRDVVLAVGEVLSDESILLVDGGNIGQWFHQLLLDRLPGHWVTCGSSGVVGWGLPGALAARALYPDRPVILLSGDGSFTFTVSELECASRQGLPFVAIVADDRRWGISASGQTRNYGEPLFSTLGPTRLDQVAEGFGCRGVRVEKNEELAPAIRAALSEDRPTVIHVPIVPGGPDD